MVEEERKWHEPNDRMRTWWTLYYVRKEDRPKKEMGFGLGFRKRNCEREKYVAIFSTLCRHHILASSLFNYSILFIRFV